MTEVTADMGRGAAPPGAERSAGGDPAVEPMLVGLGLLLFVALTAALYVTPEEDAFIYYRYALNWVHGKGLVFNPGDAVEGFSSPLWMALLGALARWGWNLPRAAPALGIGCGAATVAATWSLARQMGLDRFGRLAAVFGLALSYPFVLWSRSGLETPLYTLLLVAAARLYLAAEYPPPAEPRRPRLRLAAGVVLALVSLARPEGALLVPLVAVDRLADRRDWRGAARYALPAAAAYGAYLLWRVRTYGSLLPNTSVKLDPSQIGRSGEQLFGYFVLLGALPLVLPLLVLLGTRTQRVERAVARLGGFRGANGRRAGLSGLSRATAPNRAATVERRRLAFLVAMVAVLSLLFHLLAGGDYRTEFRFLVPTLPMVLVAFWRSAELLELASWSVPRPLASLPARLFLLSLIQIASLVLLWLNLPAAGELPRLRRQWRDPFAEASYWRVGIAFWTIGHVPAGSVVAFGQMGMVPYYATATGHDINFLDTLGLVVRQVARIYRFDRKLRLLARQLRAGRSLAQARHQVQSELAARLAANLMARHPDFIFVEAYEDNHPTVEAILRHPGFAAGYVQVGDLPGPPHVGVYALRRATGHQPSASRR